MVSPPAHYVDVQRLGDGAEGGTFTAVERDGGRRVVLKRIGPQRAALAHRVFGLLRATSSPHLPGVRALVPGDDGARWLVTDFVDGQPLGPGPVPVADALGEALSIAHALAAIHDAGTHHGDVSAANVIVTPTKGVVLTDLGQLGNRDGGTPGFLAPEVLRGRGGPASDRFALGCVLTMRLCGEVPWTRPDTLLALRRPDVRARVAAIRGCSDGVAALLRRLLDPDPAARGRDPAGLVRRLGQLRAAAQAGVDLRAPTTWWIPSRFRYRGAALQPLVQRLTGEPPPRLVVVAGPAGAGRRRVVTELVEALQQQAPDLGARSCDPAHLGDALGAPGRPWLEAWLDASGGVVGLTAPPPWPEALAQSDAPRRAGLLRATAALSRATLIVPATVADAAALKRRPVPHVEVFEVEPWTASEVTAAVADVLEGGEPAAWTDPLLAVTGGWPARVVRAIERCAAAEIEKPRESAITEALADPQADLEWHDVQWAKAVLRAHWRPGEREVLAEVPDHLHDGTRPLGFAVSTARRVLGGSVAGLAEAAAGDGDRPSLALAIDAGDVEAVRRALSEGDPTPGDPVMSDAVAWLEAADAPDALSVASAARWLLRDGEAARALALLERVDSGPEAALLRARAQQHLGRSAQALETLAPIVGDDARGRWAQALRWRSLVDLGRSEQALSEARAVLAGTPGPDPEAAATALLWASYAALSRGEVEQARAWLHEASGLVADRPGPEAAGVRARVVQLVGNLAHAQGDLVAAKTAYVRAAAAFVDAGESVGGLLLRGSLAALALDMFECERGPDDARTALRGLLARGLVQPVLEAGHNLVQLLCRIGARDEAAGIRDLIAAMIDPEAGGLPRARLRRIDAELRGAELRGAELRAGGRGAACQAAEAAFAAAAQGLADAGASREAVESAVRASALARVAGRRGAAAAHLDRACGWAGTEPDEGSAYVLAVETALLAAGAGNEDAVSGALVRLRSLPGVSTLRRLGHFDRALAVDRAQFAIACRLLPPLHPGRQAVARRFINTLEMIMSKVSNVDPQAVRAAAVSDAGDPAPLRELLAELSDTPAAPAAGVSPAAGPPEAQRLQQLLRTYRRLAREDDLERLLEHVVDELMALTDAERGAVVALGEGNDRIEVTRELAPDGDGVKFSRSVIDRVLDGGEPVLSVDAAADTRFDDSRSISHLNLRSVLAVPLRFRGEILGAAYVDHRLRRGNFDESDLAHMEQFAELAGLAVAHARALTALRGKTAALEDKSRELGALLEAREAEVVGLRDQVRSTNPPPGGRYRGMVGAAPAMQRVFRLVDRLADSDVPVVIYGESGTGKELVARAIHDAGSRAAEPFVAENCGAIPETLLESVLFGHAKGAFTGAQKAKAGLFEAAGGGTIFLDEVSEMSPAMQTKLLRVLQEGEVRRVGENVARKVDVRVIAASNRDLDALVESGGFRRDLYYRIHVVKVELPALRQRPEDIPTLVEHFVRRYADGRALEITPAALRSLCGYRWPGNVRELENEVQRWVALVEGEVTPGDLSAGIRGGEDDGLDPDDLRIRPRVDRLERDLIARALQRTARNQTRAAELLGLSRYGLQKKLRRLEGDG